MIILLIIILLAIIGIATDNIQKKARPILKGEGYNLTFFIRYSDIKDFLSNEDIDSSKKKIIKKFFRTWICLFASAVFVFIAAVIVVMFFPALAMV